MDGNVASRCEFQPARIAPFANRHAGTNSYGEKLQWTQTRRAGANSSVWELYTAAFTKRTALERPPHCTKICSESPCHLEWTILRFHRPSTESQLRYVRIVERK